MVLGLFGALLVICLGCFRGGSWFAANLLRVEVFYTDLRAANRRHY
jgi:hypothetical protein